MLDDREISSDKYSDIIDLYNRKEFESIIEKIKCLEEDKFEDPFLLNLLGATYLKLNDKKMLKSISVMQYLLNPIIKRQL